MLENIRDRGNEKWAMAMMLPEYVEELRKWREKEFYAERPELDDFDLQSIQMEIEIAFKRQCDAKVTIWKKGKTVLYIGKITELDHRLCLISVGGPFGHDRIPVADVIKVDSMD